MYPVGCNITDLGNFVVGVAVRLQMDHLALLRRQISQKRQQAVPVIHCLCQTFLPGGKKSVQFSGIFLILLQISPAHGPVLFFPFRCQCIPHGDAGDGGEAVLLKFRFLQIILYGFQIAKDSGIVVILDIQVASVQILIDKIMVLLCENSLFFC